MAFSLKDFFLLINLHLFICFAQVLKQQIGGSTIIIPKGKMRGLLVEFPNHPRLRNIEGYFGIQFASVQSVSLRFSLPDTSKERWDIVKVFKNINGPVCPQKTFNPNLFYNIIPNGIIENTKRVTSFIQKITEDCLRLNIYVPTPGMYVNYIGKTIFI